MQYRLGPWPSQERVLIFEHKPPEPEFMGSKPIGPAFRVVLQFLSILSLRYFGIECFYITNIEPKKKLFDY
jgi:hypothetical protein